MTLVYRVENARGEGPYQGDESVCSHLRRSHRGRRRAPGPYDDGIWSIRDEDLFGFVSLERLLAWFSEGERHVLDRAGFEVAIVRVPKVRQTGRSGQCTFDKRDAKRVGRMSLLTLEERKVAARTLARAA